MIIFFLKIMKKIQIHIWLKMGLTCLVSHKTTALQLTTFCFNNSNLSNFSLVTSCRRPSTRESLFCASQQRLHGLPLGVSADDILSRPVSLSTAPAMPRPSSSTLFRDDESLSDIATRLAPLKITKKSSN